MRVDVYSCVIGVGFIAIGLIFIIFRRQLMRSISAEQRVRFGRVGERVANKGRPGILLVVGIIAVILGALFVTFAVIG
jgi:hypothetical protein